MKDFLTIKIKELQWAKANNRPTLVNILQECINQFSGHQLKMF